MKVRAGLLAGATALGGLGLLGSSVAGSHPDNAFSKSSHSVSSSKSAGVLPQLLPDGSSSPKTGGATTSGNPQATRISGGFKVIPPAGGPVYAIGGYSPDIPHTAQQLLNQLESR
jgi:hypothetical protein